MTKRNFYLLIALFIGNMAFAQKLRTDANITGHVLCNNQHVPFVSISVNGTAIGAVTDETGHYQLVNLPEGTFIIKAQSIGYKPSEKEVKITSGNTIEVNFELTEDVLGLEEIVITGDRSEKKRSESSVIVNTISPKLLKSIGGLTLSDGLNFSPGLRMENNCQNCGFTQVRMNGMEGPYSQVLINGRPIFSGLAGVYGLELIPANMLERIEVIRGGGSALYGSNAVAGTINLILKDPVQNSYEFGTDAGIIGVGANDANNIANDYSVNANASVVSNDSRTGMALYGFYRQREPYDANNDGFSELSKTKNTTFGSRIFHRFGYKSKIAADFFNIKEERRGGDLFDYPLHESTISEAVNHNITTAALNYEQWVRQHDLLTVFASAQNILRDSYYGANQSLKDYGLTKGFTYSAGMQYNAYFGISTVIAGIENRGEWLNDKKLGYLDYENATIENDSIISIPHTQNTLVADQQSNVFGTFVQYDITYNNFNITLGARFDNYKITNYAANTTKNGNVFSPRVTFKYNMSKNLQLRASYAQGYRAPQIFDEDLHIETSGSRQVLHQNDPNLKQETSHSYMASADFNKVIFGSTTVGFLAEGFYSKLNDAFVNEYGEPDENGVVIYTRTNANGGALVKGVNLELNVVPNRKMTLKGGFTFQNSKYDKAHEFNEKSFFRSPGQYGFMAFDYTPVKKFGISTSANYTGKMLVPYFGPQINDPETGELRTSDPFFDWAVKLRYTVRINGASFQIFGGVKNILNSYQTDFDLTENRDPGYMYGPNQPRTIYFGIKLGNMLN